MRNNIWFILSIVISIISMVVVFGLAKYSYDDCRTNTDLNIYNCISIGN